MIQRARFEQWIPPPPEEVLRPFAEPIILPRIMPPELEAEIVRVKKAALSPWRQHYSWSAAGVWHGNQARCSLLPL